MYCRFLLCIGLMTGTLWAGLVQAAQPWKPPENSSSFNPYFDPRWSGGVEVIAEYLNLRPCVPATDYLISDSRPFSEEDSSAFTPFSLPDGTRQGIDPRRASGLRLGYAGVPRNGCGDVTVAYAGLWSTDRQNYVSPSSLPEGSAQRLSGGLWPVFGHPRYLKYRLNDTSVTGNTVAVRGATALPELKVIYTCIDAEFGIRRILRCDYWMRLFFGIRGAGFQVKEQVLYKGVAIIPGAVGDPSLVFQGQVHEVKAKAKTWGVGPRIGFDLRYDIAAGVGLGAHGGVSILSGEAMNRWHQVFIAWPEGPGIANATQHEELHFRGKKRFCLFPEVDGRLGVNYISCSGRRYFVIAEVGYEFTSFIKALVNSDFDDLAGTKATITRSFSLDGFYVSVKFRY